MSCNLLIDIGNSSAKYAFATDGIIGDVVRTSYPSLVEKFRTQNLETRVESAIISSVAGNPSSVAEALEAQGINVTVLGADTPLPFQLGYDSPDTLGADRMAAVAGAMELWPARNVLVVDAGSCVTYDFLTADGVYLGGNIAPGLRMRLSSMHEHTALLPMVEPEGPVPPIAYNTDTALRSGALMGLKHEVEGYAVTSTENIPSSDGRWAVLLTGGDAPLIRPLLNIEATVEPELVMRGLHYILKCIRK